MTEQPPSAIGTVAQEAARLIEDMATFARSSSPSGEPRPHAGGPAQDAANPPHPPPAWGSPEAAAAPESADEQAVGACSECGRDRDKSTGTTGTTEIPVTCRLCPLCRGIALLRSVRPETVDLLADLALAMAASLRDVATRSRASDPASPARAASGRPAEGDRAKVQDIPVDDDGEG